MFSLPISSGCCDKSRTRAENCTCLRCYHESGGHSGRFRLLELSEASPDPRAKRKFLFIPLSPGAHFCQATESRSSVGTTASRPSFLSPIGFHLPEGRLPRASRPVSQGRRAPPHPSLGFITGIPMAQLWRPTCCRRGPAERRAPHAEHTLALSSPPGRFMSARSDRSLRELAPHRRGPPSPGAPGGRKAGRPARPCAPWSPPPLSAAGCPARLAPCCPRAAPACSRPTCCSCWCSCPRLAATAPRAPG